MSMRPDPADQQLSLQDLSDAETSLLIYVQHRAFRDDGLD